MRNILCHPCKMTEEIFCWHSLLHYFLSYFISLWYKGVCSSGTCVCCMLYMVRFCESYWNKCSLRCQVWCCLILPSFSEAVWTCRLTILSCLWGLVLLLTIWCHRFVLSVLYSVSLFISYITCMLFYLLQSISCTIRNYFNWIFLQPFWRVANNSYGKGRGVVGKKNSTTGILWQFCE